MSKSQSSRDTIHTSTPKKTKAFNRDQFTPNNRIDDRASHLLINKNMKIMYIKPTINGKVGVLPVETNQRVETAYKSRQLHKL